MPAAMRLYYVYDPTAEDTVDTACAECRSYSPGARWQRIQVVGGHLPTDRQWLWRIPVVGVTPAGLAELAELRKRPLISRYVGGPHDGDLTLQRLFPFICRGSTPHIASATTLRHQPDMPCLYTYAGNDGQGVIYLFDGFNG